MKVGHVVGGICVAASVVCTGSILSGLGVKHRQVRCEQFQTNKYLQKIDLLNLKASYEQTYLRTLNNFSKIKN